MGTDRRRPVDWFGVPNDGKVHQRKKKQRHPSQPTDSPGTKVSPKSHERENKTLIKNSANRLAAKQKVASGGTKGDKTRHESKQSPHNHHSGQRKNKQKVQRGGANRYTDSEPQGVVGYTGEDSVTSDYEGSQSEEEVEEDAPKSARSRRYEHRSK